MFGKNLHESPIRSATHRSLVDPDFKIVLTDPDYAPLFRVRSRIDPDQHTSKNRRRSEIAALSLFISRVTRFPVMAAPPYPYQQPEDIHTPIIVVAAVVLFVLVLVGGIVAFLFYTPNILGTSSTSRDLQDPSVTSATLTCTGICNLTGQFYSDYTSQSGPIASNKPAIWQLDRPSNAIYWGIEWRINLTSTGSIIIALNTGFVVLHLQGPTSNQGSWTTSTEEH